MIFTGHSELLCMQESVMSQELEVHPSPCNSRAYLKVSLVTLGVPSLESGNHYSSSSYCPVPPSYQGYYGPPQCCTDIPALKTQSEVARLISPSTVAEVAQEAGPGPHVTDPPTTHTHRDSLVPNRQEMIMVVTVMVMMAMVMKMMITMVMLYCKVVENEMQAER